MARGKKIKEMLARVATEEGLSEFVVEDIFDSIFLISKKIIQQPEAPKVKLHNFGTFYCNLNKIDRFLRLKFSRYRQGRISRERMVELVQKYWPIRRRLQKELSTSRPKHGPKLRIHSPESSSGGSSSSSVRGTRHSGENTDVQGALSHT